MPKPKPLINPGDIIAEAWENFRAHFHAYSTFVLWYVGISIVHWAIYVIARWAIDDPFLRSIFYGGLSIPVAIAYAWISIAIIIATAKYLQRRNVNVRAIMDEATHKLFSFILVAIMYWLVIMFGLMLLVFPALIVFVWFRFATNHVILDDARGMEAMSASRNLVIGRWWETFFRIAIPGIFFWLAASFSVKLLYLVLGATFGDPSMFFVNFTDSDQVSNFYLLTTSVVPQVVNGYAAALLIGADLILWFDLKKTKG